VADGRPPRHLAVVVIKDRGSCCYFSDGDDKLQLYGDKPYYQLPIFEGKKRLGNEYFLNEKIGEIFLALTEFR